MKGIIDRFEGNYAVIEWNGSEMKDILRNFLPKDCKEGDVIHQIGESYVVDRKETEQRKKEIEELAKNLWE
jgi:hypothetical protein